MIKKLVKELRKDKSGGSTYYAWQSSIAMSIVDRVSWEKIRMVDGEGIINDDGIRDFANRCAIDFLELLISSKKDTDDNISGCELNVDECCSECNPIELKQGFVEDYEKTDEDTCFNEYINDCIDEHVDNVAIRKEAVGLAIAICANQRDIEPDSVHEDNVLSVAQQTYDFLIDKRKDIKC